MDNENLKIKIEKSQENANLALKRSSLMFFLLRIKEIRKRKIGRIVYTFEIYFFRVSSGSEGKKNPNPAWVFQFFKDLSPDTTKHIDLDMK